MRGTVAPSILVLRMACPGCDRDYEPVYYSRWSPALHPRCFWMTRIAVVELVSHCRHRDTGIGVLPLEVLLRILSLVEVAHR